MTTKRCSNCEHLGKGCHKALMLLPLDDLIDWCHHIMVQHKITHDAMAKLSQVPKGTIDRIMSKQSADCKYSTIHAMVCALFNFLGITSDCLDDTIAASAAAAEMTAQHTTTLQQALDASERERLALKERVADHESHRDFLREQIAAKDRQLAEMSETIKSQRRSLKVASSLLGIALLVIIAALVADKLNPDLGFIWRAAALGWP